MQFKTGYLPGCWTGPFVFKNTSGGPKDFIARIFDVPYCISSHKPRKTPFRTYAFVRFASACVRGPETENNNVVREDLTIVYCPRCVSRGSLKLSACVISGKLRRVARRRRTYFSRFSHAFPARTEISAALARAFEEFPCIFERVRFSMFSRRQTERERVGEKTPPLWGATGGGAVGARSFGATETRISAVHHARGRGLFLGSHVTTGGGRDKPGRYGTLIKK